MIYEKERYISPIYEWIVSQPIIEYDLEKANISVLLEEGLINKEQYDYYYALPKKMREIEIGLLQKNHVEIREGIKTGLRNARQRFFELNNLQEESILYIDKDAITTVNFMPKVTKISPVLNFRPKSRYTSFYRIFFIDLLYYNDNKEESYRLKNASKELKAEIPDSFSKGILDFILEVAYFGQFRSVIDTLNMIREVYYRYTNLQLDINFYREFNNTAKFKLNTQSQAYTYYSNNISYSDIHQIDISYNAKIFMMLYRIFSKMYFERIKLDS